MNQKRIEELEARQLALQEEMEPKRNACIEALNKLIEYEVDGNNLSIAVGFYKNYQSSLRESINDLTDKSNEKGFRDTHHLEKLLKAYGATMLYSEKFREETDFLMELINYLRDTLGVVSTAGPTGEIAPYSKILNMIEARYSKVLSEQSELVVDRMNVEAEIYEEKSKPSRDELEHLQDKLKYCDLKLDCCSEGHDDNTEKRAAANEELEKTNLALNQLIDEEKSVTEALAKLQKK